MSYKFYPSKHFPNEKDLVIEKFPLLSDFPNEYKESIIIKYLNPILHNFMVELDVNSYNIFMHLESKSNSCLLFCWIQQGSYFHPNDLLVKIRHNQDRCFSEEDTKENKEFYKQFQLCIGKILNQFIYDAQLYKSVLRNKTNSFLGPAEDLVGQYLQRQ